ncbi:molecular chaperone DnaJ [Actinokineospora globicatena]|uniref:molecular chaperone DnaJ n=1 Tax=Actinokineospora globicatena TaxID=103729 RepID=UPI0020A53FA1|nr:molecular chaperone DnaJ [Actinokineospora globicatena]MCP2301382.1 molecular chaperone DnaJ [Actinokineospora globicatena]GLW76979.1 chaperone protein DnaJ [Actinokineospora globicatena]GLW83813.1 chaperone protein DnaJ [Actinokineospora globicatena]
MSARDWIDKDFYRELGVSSDASDAEVKKAYRKLARELHPDANPGNADAEARFKSVSEAYGVVGDPEKRKQYDEARSMFGGGLRGGFGGGSGFDFGDAFGQQGGFTGGSGGGLGDLFGNLFNRAKSGGGTTARPRRGADVETDVRLDFVEAVRGATVPLRLSSPSTCDTCHGSGARPGSSPKTCVTCGGVGLVSRSQGAFAFSEPCRDCRGTGRIIDDPCPDCAGEGVNTKTRTLTVRIPAGVEDEQRIRLAGQGEPGRSGAPAGDLYVRVHVTPHPVFGRSGNDLTLKVPVSYTELALGTTLTVPTLDGVVSLNVAPGTASGRVLRVRGKGVQRRDGQSGHLLVTLQVTVPADLDDDARTALEAYAKATATHDPRPELTALVQKARQS